MTLGNGFRWSNKIGMTVAAALALACPGRAAFRPQGVHADSVWASQDEHAAAQQMMEQDSVQQAKDRAREARDREQERADRASELYDSGRDALDEEQYQQAEEVFAELAKTNGPQADAALYWKSYAQSKQGKKDSALANIAELKKRFPQSRWLKDASALEIEVRQSTGHPSKPENQSDEELRILAIHSMMSREPAVAVPLLEQVINNPRASQREKMQALFVLAQNGSPQGRQVIARIAKGDSNPEIQRKAIQNLGIFGGEEARKTLAEIYASTSDDSIKRGILQSYMVGGDKTRLFQAAKGEKNEALRQDAIRQLGLVHGTEELKQLYQNEPSIEVRKTILQAFFLSGDSQKLVEVSQSEKEAELRQAAVHNLGLINSEDSAKALQSIYAKDADREVRQAVLDAYFIQGNAKALVAIARGEKDPELKKTAVQKLSVMNSKEGTDYLMELLQK
ncbi:MAG TPA: HEAT repeat domain-containing protein [Candidatus Saccharimonadales bacterium]|nr:HEAT repeat domain-containing protein [Candidatus Saccharimonadales bacterium]